MERFINTQLHPVDACSICTEPFSTTHQPVALPCQHIFGHNCIKKWLTGGRGNTNACPTCRHILVPKSNPRGSFNVQSIWEELCHQPNERLQVFMQKLWPSLQTLWKIHPNGSFSITSMLNRALFPALTHTIRTTRPSPGPSPDPVLDCYNLISASWDSLGRPDIATGLAIPLVRLARLTANAGAVLPKYLTTSSRTNRLIWRANACLPLAADHISWDFIMQAAAPASIRYFDLLHLYTVLISQGIAHFPAPHPFPTRRHEVVNLVVERCCSKIGSGGCAWRGRPSAEFKDVLVGVYEELRKWQGEMGRMSLRGSYEEEGVVRGVWAIAAWGKERPVRS
ncbi:hypothetical protein COCMIDRAFT_36642 [Bipolaris oryzae ATCC 44560]|uniref:RING-type domain-containing protein n=1 Tax=Bipolaris oryzae ATCC 44560 TaxID=930090 RepID=W6Z779_COCMI|nr:uncharacterized protein COCMIDRAFT_36642 [Bipolaris oryzae ATCC 44560]EUC45643.1 hypothetical protein COCMIDRAFT_36642 [Bipolaris oryzae ATCC 44560]